MPRKMSKKPSADHTPKKTTTIKRKSAPKPAPRMAKKDGTTKAVKKTAKKPARSKKK